MSFSRKIRYFLVHQLQLTNRQAQALINAGSVQIDSTVALKDCVIDNFSEIKVNGLVVREKRNRRYLKFYKPRGYESTLNTQVESNLAAFFEDIEGLAIAGRLDKWSEGLLLLSNDGPWIEQLCRPDSGKEKEYLVELDRLPATNFFNDFTNGVPIGAYLTRPCFCELYCGNTIRVILTEGKNRQIRRMCGVLGFKVLNLKRMRIDTIQLDHMQAGEIETISIVSHLY